MALDSLDNRRTPERRTPLMGGVVWKDTTPATLTVGASGTLTTAQLLKGLIPMNCSGSYNLTLPTADEIVAAVPGLKVGSYCDGFQIVNHGNGTCSLVMGSGITNASIDSEVSVLTIATHQALRFALVCTGLAQTSDPSKSNTFDFHGYGVTAAATA